METLLQLLVWCVVGGMVFCGVQFIDGFGVKAVFEPGSVALSGPAVPSRWQWREGRMLGASCVLQNAAGSAGVVRAKDDFQWGKQTSNYFLHWVSLRELCWTLYSAVVEGQLQGQSWVFLSVCMCKYKPFLQSRGFTVHVSAFAMWVPRNLKLEILSTSTPVMFRGERSSKVVLIWDQSHHCYNKWFCLIGVLRCSRIYMNSELLRPRSSNLVASLGTVVLNGAVVMILV